MLFFNRYKRYFFEYEDDIHAHVLPGLDDGVKTMDEAVMIVKRMMCQGKIDDVFIQDRPSVSGEQMVCFEKSFFKFICCPVSLLP